MRSAAGGERGTPSMREHTSGVRWGAGVGGGDAMASGNAHRGTGETAAAMHMVLLS